jgi:hypothetical protein
VSKKRLAQALWIAWAIIIWNVTFDRALVVAGRQYLSAVRAAARDEGGSTHLRIDDWMRPAVIRGLWVASALSAGLLLAGLVMIRLAATDDPPATEATGPGD